MAVVKKGLSEAKLRRKEVISPGLSDLNLPPLKFTAFPFSQIIRNTSLAAQNSLSQVFSVNGVTIEKNSKPGFKYTKEICIINLSKEIISVALEYLYKKGIEELIRTTSRGEQDKIAAMRENVLYCGC